MSKSNPTKFEIKGMELYRNGEKIATRTPGQVIMEPGCENFKHMANKQLDSKKFCADNDLPSLGLAVMKKPEEPKEEPKPILEQSEGEPAITPNHNAPSTQPSPSAVPSSEDNSQDTIAKLEALVLKQAKDIEQLMEMNADRIEDAPPVPVNAPQPDSKDKKLADAEERISILEKQLENRSNSVTLEIPEEHPIPTRRKDKDNPYGIPEDQLKKHLAEGGVPCPAMDWRGTKTPKCLVWLEDNFPEFAEDRLYQFHINLKAEKKRQEKRARKKKKEDAIRADFPKEGGNLYPYRVHNEDEDTVI